MRKFDWKHELRKLIWLWLAAGILGWSVNAIAWSLLLVSLGYLAWSIWQLHRLQSWLASLASEEPPEAEGVWGEVWDSIYRRQREYKEERIRLQRVVDYLRDSFASMPDAVVMIDEGGNIEWSNQASERLLGLRYPEDTQQQLVNLLRSPDFIRYFESEDYSDSLEINSPYNPAISLQCQVTFFGKGSRLLFARDTTENQRLQQMRTDFVANVSHELRTPLTVISGYLANFLSADQIDSSHQKAYRQMFAQASRMESLIKDLLLLSRLETLPDADQQGVDLSSALEMIREEALAAFDNNRNIEIECDRALRLLGNWEELRSCFSNLVINAAKYTEPGGKITIRWYANDDHACFEVEDDGVGIEDHHLPRLTERFYRVDKGRSVDTGGTGLGLAIVKHVLMRHDATLQVSSTYGAGSVFRCVFPLSRTFIEQATDTALS